MGYYAAGIVLYYPDLTRLLENIAAISEQVDFVFCYDNGLEEGMDIEKILSVFSNVKILGTGENHGIAKAINIIAKEAEKYDIEWLLTLDQDSICPSDMISQFVHYIQMEDIGAICPLMLDKRRPLIHKPAEQISDVEFCITSGCFMNLPVFYQIGMMDEYLFIGLVDNEYCYRLRKNGYKILQVNSVELDHELGNLKPSKLAKLFIEVGNITGIDKIKSLSFKRSVSPMRVFYATRNIIYLSNKYPDSGVKEFTKKYAIGNGILSVLRAENKLRVFKAFLRGVRGALKYE